MNIIVIADELREVLNSSLVSSLLTDISESNNMMNTIDTFVTSSNSKLKGESWKAVYDKLDEYNALLKKRSIVAENLSNAIKSAINLLLNFMEDYSILDNSNLEEILGLKEYYQSTINYIKRVIYSNNSLDSKENEREYSNSEIATFRAKINQLSNEIEELDKIIEKLQKLPSVYKQAQSILEEAFSQIDMFNNDVDLIKPMINVNTTYSEI